MTTRNPDALLPLTPAMFHVLVALADAPAHGYAIMKDVEQITSGAVRLSTGTLYGIIKRLFSEGLIKAASQQERSAPPAQLTPFGREVALAEAGRLEQTLAVAKTKVLFRRA